jgi:hypothetical protein
MSLTVDVMLCAVALAAIMARSRVFLAEAAADGSDESTPWQ